MNQTLNVSNANKLRVCLIQIKKKNNQTIIYMSVILKTRKVKVIYSFGRNFIISLSWFQL